MTATAPADTPTIKLVDPASSLGLGFSPYRAFSRDEWAKLRADTPMTLDAQDVEQLAGINVLLSLQEVEDIYLPLSRLLNLYVVAVQGLHAATTEFLGKNDKKVPFIIGVAGSVAAGKSTTARVLQALLARWPDHPRVDLITTDGFLFANETLQARELMERKGFPESFDLSQLLNFLANVKAGRAGVRAPVYSHFNYDILPGQYVEVDRPDILIVEGLNVLQPAELPRLGSGVPFVSDFFDFSIYIDADTNIISQWYVERFMSLRETAFRDPAAYFHRYAKLREEDALRTGREIWLTINQRNLEENILPTKRRADLILRKGADHGVEEVELRKL